MQAEVQKNKDETEVQGTCQPCIPVMTKGAEGMCVRPRDADGNCWATTQQATTSSLFLEGLETITMS